MKGGWLIKKASMWRPPVIYPYRVALKLRLEGVVFIYAFIKLQNKSNHLDFEQISKEEFETALKGNVPIPLLEERYKVVREVSKIINEKMNGNFYEYTKNITNDVELFELIINNFPSFEDKRTYNGKTIYFYKLAQLVVSDILHIRELKKT